MDEVESGKRARLVVDRDRCIGSGACLAVNSQIFDQDDGFLVVLLQEYPTVDQIADAQAAVDACPAMAISLE